MTDPETSDTLANARLAAIIDSSFDAIIGKDLNSVIRSWNHAAERLFGFSAEEAIGQPIYIIIPDDLQQEETSIISRIRRGERVESYETIRRRKDGSRVTISITVSPIKNEAGAIVGASKIARDITATKESERRIRLLLQEVNHRVKNQYAVILAMIREMSRQPVGSQDFVANVQERIESLAQSHDLLVATSWSGADLAALVRHQLTPFGLQQLISLSGPPILLSPNAVQYIGMAIYELGTNSAKYGVLKHGEGAISVSWSIVEGDQPQFDLEWLETGGGDAPRSDEPSERKGFGTLVLTRVTPAAVSGTSHLARTNTDFRWTLSAPLRAIVAGDGPFVSTLD